MIARVGYFEGLTERQKRAQEDNAKRRLKAAITSQPGIVAALYLERPNGDRVSFSMWENESAMQEAGPRINAAHLAPGQIAEDIPNPDRVEVWQVLDLFLTSEGERNSG
jgi:hypothetical protein